MEGTGTAEGALPDAVAVVNYGEGKGDGIQASRALACGTDLIRHKLNGITLKGPTPEHVATQLLEQGTNAYYLGLSRTTPPGSFGLIPDASGAPVDAPAAALPDDVSAAPDSDNAAKVLGTKPAGANDPVGQEPAFEMTALFFIARRRRKEAVALAQATGFTVEECRRALHTVHSRSLFVPEIGHFVLVPFVEYLNHAPVPNAEVILDDGCLVVRSCREVSAGEEINISYGCHDNDVFVSQYFFVPEQNDHDELFLCMRREAIVLKLGKHPVVETLASDSNFLPFGFVRLGEQAMEIARAVAPDNPSMLIRSRLERTRFLFMVKIKWLEQGAGTGSLSLHLGMWRQYLKAKLVLVCAELDRLDVLDAA